MMLYLYQSFDNFFRAQKGITTAAFGRKSSLVISLR